VLNAVVTVKLASDEGTLPPCFGLSDREFEAYYRHFTSPHYLEDVGRTYGERLQNRPWFDQRKRMTQVNQLEGTVDKLKRSHNTESGTMVLLGPADVDSLDDAPHVVSVVFNIVEERLYGTYVLQSDDVYKAWPLNALSLLRLQREVSKRIGIPVDSATFISHSAHIYEKDWDRAMAELDRWFKRPLPLKADPSGLFFFGLQKGLVRAMLISPEVDKVLWEGEFSNPEDMARYIVDTMPWLEPQHIRYVGEEAAKLSRALREDVPYEQG
jgi:thymidylate synthase